MTVPATAPARDARTPIAGSVTRADALTQWCEFKFSLPGDTTGTGWVVAETLMAEPARFDAWRARLGDWLREHYGDAPDRTTGGYVMSWYLSAIGLLGGTLFHLARRVPALRPSDVAVRIATEDRPHIVGLALLADEFACLPDDPERDHPAATVVADEHALAALLRARFAAHATRFVSSFGPTVRLGRRQLWAAATDALDSAAWTAGQLRGAEAAGVADSALLLPAKLDPFTSASTLRATETGWTRRRESCCFHFALPDAEACVTCPRVC
ncbi:(2Fe-2S)-binding protein [Actinosynnema sp. CS-041913]|uniref:(2Fe-2S)-binding protein n=1 Tax=Actinosynnema sp. CS-041913 TaxID=3239917 RepID=UPI003D8BADA5